MARVSVDENICKGCGLCVDACKKGVLALAKDKLNAKGYHVACAVDMDACIGCAMCAQMCPDVAITVQMK